MSEVTTEKFFRSFHGTNTFLEKTEIPKKYGFKSKKRTKYKGYPDFFLETEIYAIVVEAKATNHAAAQEETIYYMKENKISKDIIGIAISGQTKKTLKLSYYYISSTKDNVETLNIKNCLISLEDIKKEYFKHLQGNLTTTESLIKTLKDLNKQFNNQNRIRDTKRKSFLFRFNDCIKKQQF